MRRLPAPGSSGEPSDGCLTGLASKIDENINPAAHACVNSPLTGFTQSNNLKPCLTVISLWYYSLMKLLHPRSTQQYQLLFIAAVLSLICLQLFMIPRVNFNWDEFGELTVLFSKESGYQIGFLRQGLHYLIWPLKYLSYSEDTLLTIARYWSFLIGTLGIYYLIFKIASLLRTPLFGLMAVFFTVTFSTFFESSIQFRTDLFTTLFFLLGFYLVLRAGNGPPPWLVPGLLLSLAMFINPKSIYHFLILLISYGYYWCYSKEKKKYFLKTFGFTAVALGSLIILLLFHSLLYNLPASKISESAVRTAQVGFGHTHGWSQKYAFVWGSLFRNLFHAACILTGLVFATRHFVSNFRFPKRTNILAIAALLGAFTIFTHQGLYKYYIINILPLLAILGALPLYAIILRILRHRKKGIKNVSARISCCIFFLYLVGCLTGIISRLDVNLRNSTINQRLHIKYLHSLFPEAIPYADGSGLLSKYNNILRLYPKRRLIQYRRNGKAKFEEYFSENFPVLIMESRRFSIKYLLAEDQEFIRKNFIPFFGEKFWIYGFRIEANALRKGMKVDVKVKGLYTLKGAHQNLFIDGRPAKTPICLESGLHNFKCLEGCEDITLTYGERSIDQVIPNFTLQANSSGFIEIEVPGRYHPVDDLSTSTTNLVMIDSLPVINTRKLEKHPSVYLDARKYKYNNALDGPVTFHLLGPVFVYRVHSG
jgi:hypothetical protein